MNIVLYCLFWVPLTSSGITKFKALTVSPARYERMKYEEGHASKIRLCKKVFKEHADLSWIEDAEPDSAAD